MNNEGKEISSGTAAKIASELTVASVTGNLDPDAVFAIWQGLHQQVAQSLIATTEALVPDFDPTTALQTAFPGTIFVQQDAPAAIPFVPAQQYVAPPSAVPAAAAPAAPAFVPQGPAPIPGASTGGNDEKAAQALEAWTVFFTDVQSGRSENWEDVRSKKKGPKSPDFKHRNWKRDGSKFTVGLWIDAKENPDWVKPELAKLGIYS
jgi:hypothetical protein